MARTVRDALVKALENLSEVDLKKFCNKMRDKPVKNGYSRISLKKLEKKDAEEVVTVIRDYYKDQYGAQLTVDVLNEIDQKTVASELEDNLCKVTAFRYQKSLEKEPPSEEKAFRHQKSLEEESPSEETAFTHLKSIEEEPPSEEKAFRHQKSLEEESPSEEKAFRHQKSLEEESPSEVTAFRHQKSKEEEPPSEVTVFGYQKSKEKQPPSKATWSLPAPIPRRQSFVDKHQKDLIQSVTNVSPVLDSLLSEELLSQDEYDRIRAKETSQEQMTELYDALQGWGKQDKEKLHEVLRRHNLPVINNLERK